MTAKPTPVETLLQRFCDTYREKTPTRRLTSEHELAMELRVAGVDPKTARSMVADAVTRVLSPIPPAPLPLPAIEPAPLPLQSTMRDPITQARLAALEAGSPTLASTLKHMNTRGTYARADHAHRVEMDRDLCGKLRHAGAREAEVPTLLAAIQHQLYINAANPGVTPAEEILRFAGPTTGGGRDR